MAAIQEDIKAHFITYPKGRNVQVYYLPSNPKVATLEPRVSWHGLLFPCGGLQPHCALISQFQAHRYGNMLISIVEQFSVHKGALLN